LLTQNHIMSSRYRIVNQNHLYFITFKVVGWIDVFSRQRYRDILIESFKYSQKEKGLLIYAYVIMTNHVHMIVSADEGKRLSDILRDMKKFTAKEILHSIENEAGESRKDWLLHLFKYYGKYNKNVKTYQFWEHDNHAVEVWSDKVIGTKINYIHDNPVRAGIVRKQEDYIYSSASNYILEEGILDVKILELFD
jgi:putative transposase